MHTECGGGKVQEWVREPELESLSCNVHMSPHHSDRKVRELEPVLHEVHDGPNQPFQRGDLL